MSVQGGVADITMWFEFIPGVDLSTFQVSGVPIGPTSLTDMTLIENTCGITDTCAVSCVTVNGIASGQFSINGQPLVDYSAPLAACIPAPPADCAQGPAAPTSEWR